MRGVGRGHHDRTRRDALIPHSCAERNVVRCKEYRTSRRSSGPTTPDVLQAAAQAMVPSLLERVSPGGRSRKRLRRILNANTADTIE